jgi:WD40 repeat protein
MKRLLILSFALLSVFSDVYAQHVQKPHTCQPILDKVRLLIQQRSVEAQEALNHLNICDRKNELILERNRLQNQINRINQEEKERAQQAEKKAVKSKNAEIDARLATVREQMVSDSLKVRNYNMRQALSTMQENPTIAWGMVEHLRGNATDYKDLAEVVYSIASDPKNEAYLKHISLQQPVVATAWNEKNEFLVADATGLIRTYNTSGVLTDTFEFNQPLPYQQMVGKFNREATYFFYTRGDQDSTLVIVNMETKRAEYTLELPERIYSLGFSSNLLYIAVGMHNKIRCYNLSETPATFIDVEFKGIPTILTVNNLGILASAETFGNLHFFNIKEGGISIETFNPKLQNMSVRSAAFTTAPDVLLVGGAGFEAALCTWHGDAFFLMNGHVNNITAFDIDYNKNLVATGSSDKTIRLWSMEEDPMRERAILRGHLAQIQFIAFSPDGQYLATTDAESQIKLWRTHGKKKGNGHLKDNNLLIATTFGPSNGQILAGGTQGGIGLFDTLGNLLKVYQNPSGDSVKCLLFINNTRFVTGSVNGDLCMWRKNDTIPFKIVNTGKDGVNSLAVSADGKKIIAGYRSGNVRIFNAQLDSVNSFHSENSYAIKAATFSGENIVVADSRGHIRFYDKNYTALPDKYMKTKAIHEAAVSQNGRYMLTSNNHDVRLWDLEYPKRSFDLDDAHANRVSGLAFSPDERFILTASWDNTAIVWAINGKKMYKVATGASVMSIAASGSGRLFATGSGALDVWRMPDVYLEECVENIPTASLMQAGVLMDDIKYYEAANDLHLLRKAAQQFGSIGSWYTADTLFALALEKVEKQVSQLKKMATRKSYDVSEEESDWLSIKRDIELDRAEMRIDAVRSGQEITKKEAFLPLIQTCKDPNELVAYAEYSFAHREWKALKSASERHRIITKKTALWTRKYLYYANVMLQHKQLNFSELTNLADLDDLGALAQFYAAESTNLPDSLMLKKMAFAEAAYRIMVRYDQLHKNDPATIQYLTNQCLNLGWYQLLGGHAARALQTIGEGQALCRRNANPMADSLLLMNKAHALLLTGEFSAAVVIYRTLAPFKFIDNRFATFSDAFLDDIRLFREADNYSETKGKVIGTRYQQDVQRIETMLREKGLGQIIQKGPTTSDVKVQRLAPVEYIDTKTVYAVVLKSFTKREAAEDELQIVQQQMGYSTASIVLDSQWYQVVVQAFDNMEDARKLQKSINEQFGINTLIVRK